MTLRDEAEILAAEASADAHPERRDVQRLLIDGADVFLQNALNSTHVRARAGVIEMVYGRDAVLQAEYQAQMLQGRMDVVDNSCVSPK